ncbi:MAG: nucleotide exchange factor GrpE [Pelagibacteraceae bacterium TMED124]|nr:MAG: nucleotide exchange factor GrpE [Pelagibacteraceae bacterium TMED124]|tara:strand:+ start:2638 stop:3213 length:576 start_codon:yes stop_codon:yes gene_type:complete
MANLNDEDNKSKKDDPVKKEEKRELTTEEKLKDTEEKLLRSLAELENQRKRFEKDIKEAIDFGGFNFAKENLVILDNLQRAYISIKNDPVLKNNKDIDKFLNNIEIIEKDLITIFKKNKIEKIDTKNKKFDPNFHQAMTEMEDDKVEPGTIVQEMLAGYMFGDRLLRPSLVAVSKKKAQNEVKKPEKNEKK